MRMKAEEDAEAKKIEHCEIILMKKYDARSKKLRSYVALTEKKRAVAEEKTRKRQAKGKLKFQKMGTSGLKKPPQKRTKTVPETVVATGNAHHIPEGHRGRQDWLARSFTVQSEDEIIVML